jgi:indolepyruvate ferredoxin oxidoreductase alpha subunit
VANFQNEESLCMHTQWAINEKVAFEIAYAGCQTGLRAAVSMKQVGLNVASDPLMSAAYLGVKGGFVLISADDPGPHSSQTEQDSRLMAMFAKIPVLDPDSPRQAKELMGVAYEISESFKTPVMVRPTTRVCHSRQDISLGAIKTDRHCKVSSDSPQKTQSQSQIIQGDYRLGCGGRPYQRYIERIKNLVKNSFLSGHSAFSAA